MESLDYYLNINKSLFDDMEIVPAFKENNVAIVYSSSDAFAKYLSVSIQSLLNSSSKKKNYDIIVLETKLSDVSKQKIEDLIKPYTNSCIRFLNLEQNINALHPLFYVKGALGYETYYRLFLDKILKNYSKVLYLDADTVILNDINELYEVDLKDYLIAASLDIVTISQASRKARRENLDIYSYITDVLELDHDRYIQGGVVLFNLEKCKDYEFSNKAIEKLYQIRSPFFVDQDIINVICKDRILFLPPRFNFGAIYKRSDRKYIRMDLAHSLDIPREDICILHLTGPKPCRYPEHEYAELFWKVARSSPFYEVFIFENIMARICTKNLLLDGGLPEEIWETIGHRFIVNKRKYNHYKRKVKIYRLLSIITFGNRRKRYQEKEKETRRILERGV